MTALEVNDGAVEVDAPTQKPLLWVLREDLGLRGTKYGCGVGRCGACTVQIEGEAVRSCQVRLYEVADAPIRTIEGLDDDLGARLKAAWRAAGVPACGYCQAGQIMAAHALLSRHGGSVDEAMLVEQVTNLCRCGTYGRIRQAVLQVAAELRS